MSGQVLADFEEAESKWEEGHALYAVWMASSAVSFLSSLFWLQIGFLTGAPYLLMLGIRKRTDVKWYRMSLFMDRSCVQVSSEWLELR